MVWGMVWVARAFKSSPSDSNVQSRLKPVGWDPGKRRGIPGLVDRKREEGGKSKA